MNSDLSQRINPSTSPFGNSKIGIDTTNVSAPVRDSTGDQKPDFANLVGLSNIDVKEDRKAKKKGELTGKTDQELFDSLNKETTPKNLPKNQLDKDDFLKLFIAQLQNQDPLKPKEDYEMAAQMAQFNGLEQMLNLNKKIEDLVGIQKQGQAVTMIDYVGKEVSVEGGRALFDGKTFSGLSYKADMPINEAVLSVRDGSGTVVAEENIGVINAGEHKLTQSVTKGKDGAPLRSGVYTASIKGKGPQGEPVALPFTSTLKVTGIDIKNNTGSFKTAVGTVGIDEINSVATPVSNNPAEAPEQSMEKTVSGEANAEKPPFSEQAIGTPQLTTELEAKQEKGEASAAPYDPKNPTSTPNNFAVNSSPSFVEPGEEISAKNTGAAAP